MNKFLLYLSIANIIGCANPVVPTGGPKDVTPPQLIKTNILPLQTNIKPSKVEFHFDENIQASNLSEDVVVSPVIFNKPRFVTNKKSIVLYIDTNSLYPYTTYSISLNQTISDLNEGNKTSYKPLLFSTGNNIDTGEVYAHVYSFNNLNYKKLKSFVTDSSAQQPLYKGSLKDQNFTFYGLKNGAKKIIVFDDLNGNDTADDKEPRGFGYSHSYDTAIITIYPSQTITLKLWNIGSGFYKIFGLNPSYIESLLKSNSQDIYSMNDTLYCTEPTLNLLRNQIPQELYMLPKNADKGKIYNKPKFQLSQFSSDTFVHLYYQSDTNIDNVTFSNNKGSILPSYKTKKNSYSIKLTPESTITIKSNNKDSFIYRSIILQQSTFENNNEFPIRFLIKHTATGQVFIKNIEPNKETTIGLLKGEYEILYWQDKNNDHHISPPSIDFTISGEEVKTIKSLSVKGNIDFHMKLSFNKQGE